MSNACELVADAAATDDMGVGDGVELRRISIDDWSDVRYVHATAFRTLVGPYVGAAQLDIFNRQVTTPEYVDSLLDADLFGAWLNGELVGTAGWLPVAPGSRTARIVGLYVRPLCTAMGIGSRLLIDAEARARAAGFVAFTAYSTAGSLPFFEINGYDIAGHERMPGSCDRDAPVIVMRKRDATASEAVGQDRPATCAAPAGDGPRLALAMERTHMRATAAPHSGTGLLFGEVPPRKPFDSD